jgi:hypothetical protein
MTDEQFKRLDERLHQLICVMVAIAGIENAKSHNIKMYGAQTIENILDSVPPPDRD